MKELRYPTPPISFTSIRRLLKGVLRSFYCVLILPLAGLEAQLVSEGANGLVYNTYSNQNQTSSVHTVPDFSMAGYQGGGVAIPFVPAATTLSPSGGDDTTAIQDAIDYVSGLPVGANGFRGAVVLTKGDYTVSSPLRINTSGVVIRGAGSQENGGTTITYTATSGTDVILINGGSGPSEVSGSRVNISDAYVPVGATSFNVTDASGFSPGDQIMVQNMVNQAWIDDLSNMGQWGWSPGSYQIKYRFTVTAVNGNEITIDSPILQTIEDQYGGGDAFRYTDNLLENIGVEAIRFVSSYLDIADENHGAYAVEINKLENGWVRQVTAQHFVQGAVKIDTNSQFITVEDCAALDHISMISGGRRYSFNLDDSQYVLFQRCYTREGRHDYVSGSRTPGPNAFVDSRADNTHSDTGPHHRYATGQVYDNIKGGSINAGKNARGGGSGQGWTGAQIMLWNSEGSSLRCDAPNGAMNWSVGNVGSKTADSGGEPFGIWESEGVPVTPRSLYYAQLEDRLGINALNRVILPKQKTGTIWTELQDWAGNGLFLDELVVLADEEAVPNVGESVGVQGIVRNLRMLDNGATIAWRKVYGLGSATFADAAALETTVSFSQDGSYLLELTVDDGSSVLRGSALLTVGNGGADTTPPAVPSGFAATDTVSSVDLDWADNNEGDLAGYDVFRSTVLGEQGIPLAFGLTSSQFTDLAPEKGVLYYYTVRAVDTNSMSSLSAEASAMVNAPPEVAFTSPEDGYAFNEGDSITVTADASDKGGSITHVELFVDGQSAGQDTTAPYEWSSSPLLQNLAVGTYTLQAVATDNVGTTSSVSISTPVEVDSTAPSTPTGLTAVANYDWVALDWADNTEHDLAGYNIYRSTTSGNYGASVATVTTSDYDDLTVTGGADYYYTVTATDVNGFESVMSTEILASPKARPTGMLLFGSNYDGKAGFTELTPTSTQIWTMNPDSFQYRNENTDNINSSLLQSFVLNRSSGQSYRMTGVLELVDGYAEDNNRIGLYLFGDSAEIPGSGEAGSLYFRINFEGGSIAIAEGVNGTTLASATHGRAKDFTWFDNEEVKFTVDMTFNGTNIEIVATITDALGDSTSLSHSVLASSYTGDYFGFATRTRTRDFGVEGSIKSSPFTANYKSFWLTDIDNTAPLAPDGLSAVAGNNLVTLDWNDSAESDFESYSVYRTTTSGVYEDALIEGLTGSTYVDNGAVNGITFYYVVMASDYHGNTSLRSAEVSTTPLPPTGLSATSASGSIDLDWNANLEPDLVSYNVYRGTVSGSYDPTPIATGLLFSQYSDSNNLVNDTLYFYAVTAVNEGARESLKSAEESVTYVVNDAAPMVDAGPDQSVVMSGDFAWTPAQIPTVAWYDASDTDTITESGGKISQWADKSGNAHHATQPTGAAQPTYQASDPMMGDQPSIGDSAATGAIGLNTPSMSAKTVYAVTYYKDGLDSAFDGYSTLFSGPGSWGEYRLMGDQSTDDFISTFNFNDAGTFKNGSSTSSSTGVLPMPASLFVFKASEGRTQEYSLGFNSKYTDRDWQGAYSEFIFTDGTEDLAAQQKIEGYLAHKWGLEANLPTDHPYKTSPPGISGTSADMAADTSDPDGNPLTYTWTKVSGPESYSFDDASLEDPAVTITDSGTYVFELTADDGFFTTTDEVTVLVKLDADGDGIDDSWETTYFTGQEDTIDGSDDSDGDGVLDFFEYLYGSDPTDSSSLGFKLEAGPSSGSTVFEWDVDEGFVLGTDYVVKYSTDLSDPVGWQTLPPEHYTLTPNTSGGKTSLDLEITADLGDNVFIRLVQP